MLGGAKRQPWLLPLAATAATAAAVAALWAAAVSAEWYVYPLLVTAALAVASRELWAHWDRAVATFGWSYAAMLALSPLALFFVALLGVALPARRAARVDPIVAIRGVE